MAWVRLTRLEPRSAQSEFPGWDIPSVWGCGGVLAFGGGMGGEWGKEVKPDNLM